MYICVVAYTGMYTAKACSYAEQYVVVQEGSVLTG